MTFKKLTQDEIKYAHYDNLVGIPYIEEDVTNRGSMRFKKLRKRTEKAEDTEVIEKNIFDGIRIPIKIDISEKFQIEEGEIVMSAHEQWISVENVSERDKIWNLRLDFANDEHHYKIAELNPSEKWREELFGSQENVDLPLKVKELVSKKRYPSEHSEETKQVYLDAARQNTLYFTLLIENTSKESLNDIYINKKLPDATQRVAEVRESVGTVNSNKKRLIAQVETLRPDELIKIRYKLLVSPRVTNTGSIEVQCKRTSYSDERYLISKFNGSTKTAQFIEIEEQDEHPGVWDCAVKILNQSEYFNNVTEASLYTLDNDKKKIVDTMKETIRLEPFDEKVILETSLRRSEQPNLIKEIKFAPEYEMTMQHLSVIDVSGFELQVIDVVTEKSFSKSAIKSYEASDFDADVSVNNLSSVDINHIFMHDILPREFSYGNTNTINIYADDDEISLQKFREENDIFAGSEEIDSLKRLLKTSRKEKQGVLDKIADLRKKIKKNEGKLSELSSKDVDEVQQKRLDEIENLEKEISENEKKLKTVENKLKKAEAKEKEILNEISENEDKYRTYQRKNKMFGEKGQQEDVLETLNTQIKVTKKNVKKLKSDQKEIEKWLEENERKLSEKENEEKKSDDKGSKDSKDSKEAEKEDKADEDSEKENEESKKLAKRIKKKKKELKSIKSELKKVENKITLLRSQKSDISSKLKDIEKNLKTISKELPKKFSPGKVTDKISKLKESLSEQKQAINSHKRKVSVTKKAIKNVEEKLDKQQNEMKDLKQKLEKDRKIKKEIKNLEKTLKKRQSELNELNKEISQQESRVNLLTDLSDDNVSIESKIDKLSAEFTQRTKDKPASYFEAFAIKDSRAKKHLFVILNHLDQFLKPIKADHSLHIQIPVKGVSPKNKKDYNFPTNFLLEYLPLTAIQAVDIPKENLPSMEIIHKRRKISLGKIVEAYDATGRFAISLLVRNNAHHPAHDVRIIDKLPASAKISNAFYEYREEETEDELKNVIWTVDSLPPLQEVQISYVIDLEDSDFDLNNLSLAIEQDDGK